MKFKLSFWRRTRKSASRESLHESYFPPITLRIPMPPVKPPRPEPQGSDTDEGADHGPEDGPDASSPGC